MLHITSSINTNSEFETIPVSHITEEVIVQGSGLDLVLQQHFQNTDRTAPNSWFLQTSDFEVNKNLNDYPLANMVCKICWTDIENDFSHESIKHPACFCSKDTRYSTPRALEEHFKTHQTPIQFR